LKLDYSAGSPFSRIIRILIRELGLDIHETEIRTFPPPPAFFAINPLGQVPALETDDGPRSPTGLIIDYVMALPTAAATDIAASVRRGRECWQDQQLLAVILAMGDALSAMKYQDWAGLAPTGRKLVGHNPAERHMQRLVHALERKAGSGGFLPGVLSVQDIAAACFILWAEARGGLPWRGRTKLEAIVKNCSKRQSFIATEPQPWP
jgi:glutathione S-transferase